MARASGGQLIHPSPLYGEEFEGQCGQPLSPQCLCLSYTQPPRAQKPPTPARCPQQGSQQGLIQQRAIQLPTGSETLAATAWGGPPRRLPAQGFLSGLVRAPLGQRSAERHDGQAEEGAEVGRGLGWRVGGPLGLGVDAALLWLVAR